ncbi:SEL1-like repeat protein [Alteriqipengyuania sp.]|uniref:SEL1-like repeat protein n=1 Tax=Alteriqipengyuania sp. TaxID=2800692 RepID=UPI0035136D3D
MRLTAIETTNAQPAANDSADLAIAHLIGAASEGDAQACYELGVIWSTGSHGVDCDLIEAHQWFNLAAAQGHQEAAWCRTDISDEMTAREIAEAQRRARQWLGEQRKSA